MANPKLCSIPDCGKPAYGHGWCSAHYSRWYRHGDPLAGGSSPTDDCCSIEGCARKHYARGWCSSHYKKWLYQGDPNFELEGVAQKFLRETVLTYSGNECLIWPYSRSGSGYAQMNIDGKIRIVPRIVCEERHGPPPSPAHQAAHSCGKGEQGCVTRNHLDWKTPKGNAADKANHGTESRGERHGSSKLTEAAVREIRASNETLPVLASRFGVSQSNVSMVRNGKTWAWLD